MRTSDCRVISLSAHLYPVVASPCPRRTHKRQKVSTTERTPDPRYRTLDLFSKRRNRASKRHPPSNLWEPFHSYPKASGVHLPKGLPSGRRKGFELVPGDRWDFLSIFVSFSPPSLFFSNRTDRRNGVGVGARRLSLVDNGEVPVADTQRPFATCVR